MVFIIVQHLVGIDAAVSITASFNIFKFGEKMLIHVPKVGF